MTINDEKELLKFLQEKRLHPFCAFTLLFKTMVTLTGYFRHPTFREEIDNFGEDFKFFQKLEKGIIDLAREAYLDEENYDKSN